MWHQLPFHVPSPALSLSCSQGVDNFTAKVDIEVSQASAKAIEAVEKQGGRIVTAYYNRLGLKVLLKPERFEGKLRQREGRVSV